MLFDDNLKSTLVPIAKRFGIKLLMVHGSYAKGTASPKSDLDIAFLCYGSDIEFGELLELQGELEKLFTFPGEIDLHSLHKVDSLFLFEVAKCGILLVGDKNDYDDFRLHALARYEDTRELRMLERKLIDKQQNRWRTKYGQ